MSSEHFQNLITPNDDETNTEINPPTIAITDIELTLKSGNNEEVSTPDLSLLMPMNPSLFNTQKRRQDRKRTAFQQKDAGSEPAVTQESGDPKLKEDATPAGLRKILRWRAIKIVAETLDECKEAAIKLDKAVHSSKEGTEEAVEEGLRTPIQEIVEEFWESVVEVLLEMVTEKLEKDDKAAVDDASAKGTVKVVVENNLDLMEEMKKEFMEHDSLLGLWNDTNEQVVEDSGSVSQLHQAKIYLAMLAVILETREEADTALAQSVHRGGMTTMSNEELQETILCHAYHRWLNKTYYARYSSYYRVFDKLGDPLDSPENRRKDAASPLLHPIITSGLQPSDEPLLDSATTSGSVVDAVEDLSLSPTLSDSPNKRKLSETDHEETKTLNNDARPGSPKKAKFAQLRSATHNEKDGFWVSEW